MLFFFWKMAFPSLSDVRKLDISGGKCCVSSKCCAYDTIIIVCAWNYVKYDISRLI